MKEPDGEGRATRSGPESCGVGSNAQAEALTGGVAGRVLSCEIKSSSGPTLLTYAEGNTGVGAEGESTAARTQSKTPHMQGHFLHGNRETPVASCINGMQERAGKAAGRTPAMHATGESDAVIVPEKLPNKAVRAAAEAAEGRTATERNAEQSATLRTPSRVGVPSGLAGVRAAARRDRKLKFSALLHHVSPELLRVSFFALKRAATPGIDEVTWIEYEDGHEERLADLHRRIHTGAYRALPSKRSYIPKPDGQQRPLGIAALEDKIVQHATGKVLSEIYEVDFAGFSYGFRPGRKQHDCLDALATALMRKRVNWVLDADIRRFFDTIDHEWMLKFLEHRIAERRIIRLIQRWLKAGVMEDGVWMDTTEGTPQGAVISPLLANIYLHYVFDLWASNWRKKKATGEMYLVRYADDFVVCFERKEDGMRFQADLGERLGSFGLALHPDKTRLIEFGRFAANNRKSRGEGRPEVFNFLGFMHYCGKTRAGAPLIWRKTIAKRLSAKVKAVGEKLMKRRHEPIPVLGAWLGSVVRGYFNYHAVPGNRASIGAFHREICRAWLFALRRRSQRSRMPWQRFKLLILRWLPKPETKHPYPWARFAATHSM